MATYTYQENDEKIKAFASKFVSRLGDNSGPADQDYFDMIRLLFSMKRDGSLLDIGAGLGRVTQIAKEIMAETVALEPDQERWQQCHEATISPLSARYSDNFRLNISKTIPVRRLILLSSAWSFSMCPQPSVRTFSRMSRPC